MQQTPQAAENLAIRRAAHIVQAFLRGWSWLSVGWLIDRSIAWLIDWLLSNSG